MIHTHENITAIGINSLGVLISIFSIYVILQLYLQYGFRKLFYFLVSAIAVFLWNITNLLHNIIGENNYELARDIWILKMVLAIILAQSTIFGFISLTNRRMEEKFMVYSTFFLLYLSLFVSQNEWTDIKYNKGEGWNTIIIYTNLWISFIIIFSIIVILEIIGPLVATLKYANKKSKKYISGLIASISLATSSNWVLVILPRFNLSITIQFMLIDISFLIFFTILYVHPLIGFYDPTILNDVLLVIDKNQLTSTKSHQINRSYNRIHDLNKFRVIFHPIKLQILKILSIATVKGRSQLMDELHISSSKIEYHLKIMRNNNLIISQTKFTDDGSRIYFSIEPKGLQIYNSFCDTLEEFIQEKP